MVQPGSDDYTSVVHDDDRLFIDQILQRIQPPTIISYSLPSNYVKDQAYTQIVVIREDGGNSSNAKDTWTDELFLKRVIASSHDAKSWTDMRRKLIYLRTEVRFYNEIVPLLLHCTSNHHLGKHLPAVIDASYNLDSLIPEDSPTTFANQPSPLPAEDYNETRQQYQQQQRDQLLKNKGGHILLQSLSSSIPTNISNVTYYQDSPMTIDQSSMCLTALAELHASAWGNVPLLQQISDRLSNAGGSYSLQFRNPNELLNIVASWENFRTQFLAAEETAEEGGFIGHSNVTGILKKESVVRLGQRLLDMAEYISRELSPSVNDEFATLVHGDYKAMNVFLPMPINKDKEAIMIDFSCTGIGYGMSDVGMHIAHAIRPCDLINGGEETLIEGYISALEVAMNRNAKQLGSKTKKHWEYPRETAMRHYRFACVDYLRFVMGRFWRTASPESFHKKKDNKNVTLINRNCLAAMAFIEKVDCYLVDFEREKKDREKLSNISIPK